MTLEEEVERGRDAARVLTNRVYQEAYEAIRENLWKQLSQVELADDKRARLNSLVVALGKVHGYLETVMQGGKLAAAQIEQDRKFGQRVRDRIGL